jgi:carboxypeptidase T
MRRSGSALLLTLLLLCSGYVAVQSVSSASASASLTPREVEGAFPSSALIDDTSGAKQPDAPIVVRIYGDEAQLRGLAQHLDVWEVHREAGYLVAMVWPEQLSSLGLSGSRIQLDPAKTALLSAARPVVPDQTAGIPGYPCYRTVEETFATAQQLVDTYPQLVTWIDIGDSWEKTVDPAQGYDLRVLRLTNASVPGPKPKLFIMSSIHAREYTPAELSTRFAEYLVANYGVDPDVTWILDYHEIHLLLLANPDGRKYAEQGLYWRKNTNNNFCTGTDLRGVDLNRNFEFQWACCQGSSPMACEETFQGPAPASEPEVQAVQDYLRAEFADQRGPLLSAAAPLTTTGVFMDLHSYSELVMWPWGFSNILAPNEASLATLGHRLAAFNGYLAQSASYLYFVDGDTVDFAYGELGMAAYVFELGTSFFQRCDVFEETILPENLGALLYAARVARAPYLLPSGPDVTQIRLRPQGVVRGMPVQVWADVKLEDVGGGITPSAGSSDGNVAAAEFYVDVPPWVTTTAPISHTMAALDGTLDTAQETAIGHLDTTELEPGRHTVFVRAQSEDGVWGPFSAAFLTVVKPKDVARIDGYVRDGADNAPLRATVAADIFEVQTDPSTGYFVLEVISGTYDLHLTAAGGYNATTFENVAATDGQTTRQNAYLYRPCVILSDDVESGSAEWTATARWAITDEASHSPSHAWTDSPGRLYEPRTSSSLISPIFDLTDYAGGELSFWHTLDLDGIDDSAVVYGSPDGGDTWKILAAVGGQPVTWTQQIVALPLLDGQTKARFRFTLTTGPFDRADGWHVDDITFQAAGPGCVTPMAPVAAFTHTQAILGAPVRFTNLTRGTPPFETLWDFGDGRGSSRVGDPSYVYGTAGSVTVTLVISNSTGRDQVTYPLVIADLAYHGYLPLLLKD